MSKTTNSNHLNVGSPGATFNRRISADGDTFDRNDVDALGHALDEHDHTSGKGKPPGGMTTAGDTIYGGASGVGTRLAVGAARAFKVVNSGATAPEWVANPVLTAKDPPAAGELTLGSIVGGRAQVDVSGGVPSLADDYNVSGIVDDGVGLYAVSWDLDFANTGYSVAITAEGGNYGSITAANVLVGSAQIRTIDAGGAAVDVGAHITATGDQ